MVAFRGRFDGKVIVPDEPIDLPPGQVVNVVAVIPGQPVPRFAELLLFAADLPDAPADLSTRHDDRLREPESSPVVVERPVS